MVFFEAETGGADVTSLVALRLDADRYVKLTVRIHGATAGVLTFDLDQQDAFVWVTCKLGRAVLCTEDECPFPPHEIKELFGD